MWLPKLGARSSRIAFFSPSTLRSKTRTIICKTLNYGNNVCTFEMTGNFQTKLEGAPSWWIAPSSPPAAPSAPPPLRNKTHTIIRKMLNYDNNIHVFEVVSNFQTKRGVAPNWWVAPLGHLVALLCSALPCLPCLALLRVPCLALPCPVLPCPALFCLGPLAALLCSALPNPAGPPTARSGWLG